MAQANARAGGGTEVTQQVLRRALSVRTGLSPRATRFRGRLRELLPSPMFRPPQCPDLLELGSPAYLTGDTRHELVQLRDRALAAAAATVADEQAREALPRQSVT